jgi:high-affinity iron transporter
MLRLILSFSLAAAAVLPPDREEPKAEASEAQPLRRVVALLDYVSGDYARAVGPSGEVLSQAEHQEQIGFVKDAARELRADAGAKGEDLAQKLDALAKEVSDRAPPSRVAAQAKAARDEIVQRFHVVLLPLKPPDLAHGAQVYAQSCAACHGLTGHPNLALGLETKPPDFAVPDEVKPLSPQRIFNAETYGVPRTAMPAFDTGLDDASRWDVAFYVLTLAHPRASQRGLELARAALVPFRYRDLAALSDAELSERLAAAGFSAREQEEALAALRGQHFTDEAEDAQPQGLAQARHDIARAAAIARQGDREAARRTLISAYLDHFEPHEAGLRARDSALVTEVETAFLALRASIESGQEVDRNAARLDALLEKADARPRGGALVAFIGALVIALREGVEAALLVAAMLALLRKAGRETDANAVHLGWLSALLGGAVTWWLSGMLIARISGTHRELIEGVLQLVLAALILYASHWLFHAMSSRKLVATFFQRSMAGASSAVVLGITFIAVYREAFETVLFFRALVLESPGNTGAVALGALLGLMALVALVAAFQRLGKKLKPRLLLVSCGMLLSGLAVLMVGNGVRSLQVLGVLPLTVWGAFQVPALGLYATREGLLAQGLVVVFLAGSALWHSLRGESSRRAHAAA